jgi:hypothetical protein
MTLRAPSTPRCRRISPRALRGVVDHILVGRRVVAARCFVATEMHAFSQSASTSPPVRAGDIPPVHRRCAGVGELRASVPRPIRRRMFAKREFSARSRPASAGPGRAAARSSPGNGARGRFRGAGFFRPLRGGRQAPSGRLTERRGAALRPLTLSPVGGFPFAIVSFPNMTV